MTVNAKKTDVRQTVKGNLMKEKTKEKGQGTEDKGRRRSTENLNYCVNSCYLHLLNAAPLRTTYRCPHAASLTPTVSLVTHFIPVIAKLVFLSWESDGSPDICIIILFSTLGYAMCTEGSLVIFL